LDNNEYSIGRWISILYRYGQCYISKNLEPYGIGSGQYIFLIALYKRQGINQGQLSEYLRVDKATTAKAIKHLEKEGYITRDIDEKDKRAYKLFLTQKALDIRSELYKILRKWEDVFSAGLAADEKKTFLKTIEHMAENASTAVQPKTLSDIGNRNTAGGKTDHYEGS
jgi:DNA-binding MarR family transcriptional regulator